jgi:hypothetical protein
MFGCAQLRTLDEAHCSSYCPCRDLAGNHGPDVCGDGRQCVYDTASRRFGTCRDNDNDYWCGPIKCIGEEVCYGLYGEGAQRDCCLPGYWDGTACTRRHNSGIVTGRIEYEFKRVEEWEADPSCSPPTLARKTTTHAGTVVATPDGKTEVSGSFLEALQHTNCCEGQPVAQTAVESGQGTAELGAIRLDPYLGTQFVEFVDQNSRTEIECTSRTPLCPGEGTSIIGPLPCDLFPCGLAWLVLPIGDELVGGPQVFRRLETPHAHVCEVWDTVEVTWELELQDRT